MIALVDYGAGNLASVRKALAHIGASVWTPTVPGELGRAHGIIVPGVGHFDATKALTDDWRSAIRVSIEDKTPFLGICVGLQWMFEGSAESPDVPGLALLKGTSINFTDYVNLKVPHVGWNALTFPTKSRLMAGIADGTQVYFTHSYAAPVVNETVAICEYGVPFTAALERDHISGVQFHPEKSGEAGLQVLHNWTRAL